MKKLVILALLISSTYIATAQIEMERVKVTKEISMEVPVTFTPLSMAELYQKYVSARPPIAMYSSPDRQIDLGVNENSSTWVEDDLEILKSFYKANIANLFSEIEFLQEDIKQIGDRRYVVFEFVSRVTDEESTFGNNSAITKYSYLQYTIKDDRVLLFNFTCPARLQSRWQDPAKQIMESIRIK